MRLSDRGQYLGVLKTNGLTTLDNSKNAPRFKSMNSQLPLKKGPAIENYSLRVFALI